MSGAAGEAVAAAVSICYKCDSLNSSPFHLQMFSRLSFALAALVNIYPGRRDLGCAQPLVCGFCFCCFGAEHRLLLCNSLVSVGLVCLCAQYFPSLQTEPWGGDSKAGISTGSECSPKSPGCCPGHWSLRVFGAGGVLFSLHRTLGRNAEISVAFLKCCELSAMHPVRCSLARTQGVGSPTEAAGAKTEERVLGEASICEDKVSKVSLIGLALQRRHSTGVDLGHFRE